jgi:membrane associated rhomboid family serine protease
MLNLTPVVRNLLIVNVVVFIVQSVMPISTYYLELFDIPSGNFKPYQFLSYMFAHGSFLHIFFNMIWLVAVAPILETYWGDRKFLMFYLASGIGAGVVYTVVNYFLHSMPGPPMVGASGAIFGVLMAFGLTFPNMQISLYFIPIRAKYLVYVMGGLSLLFGGANVAHLAHFGGALVGYLLVAFWRGPAR